MPKPNPKLILPGSIRDFVARQATLPVETFLGNRETPDCPYGQYWLRAVAAMLLSGRIAPKADDFPNRSEEHTSELQSLAYLVCRLLLEKKNSAVQQTIGSTCSSQYSQA